MSWHKRRFSEIAGMNIFKLFLLHRKYSFYWSSTLWRLNSLIDFCHISTQSNLRFLTNFKLHFLLTSFIHLSDSKTPILIQKKSSQSITLKKMFENNLNSGVFINTLSILFSCRLIIISVSISISISIISTTVISITAIPAFFDIFLFAILIAAIIAIVISSNR